MAHFKLSHSQAFLLRAYSLQTHEILFDAHNQASRCWAASHAAASTTILDDDADVFRCC